MGDLDLFFKVTEVKNFVIYSTLIYGVPRNITEHFLTATL